MGGKNQQMAIIIKKGEEFWFGVFFVVVLVSYFLGSFLM
jgi:hypothetical protein